MTEKFDLFLFPLMVRAGMESPESMTIHISEPGRGSARGRSSDSLALCLAMSGNSILSPGKQKQALEHLASLYFKTPGSATSAMRAVISELNSLFLKRNQNLSSAGKQGIGSLAQLVLRGNQLYMAFSGPLHMFTVHESGIEHSFNTDLAGKSVGQTRYPPLWFSQAVLHLEDVLVLATPPLPIWDENVFRQVRGQNRDSIIKILHPKPDIDINVVCLQVKHGKGTFKLELSEASGKLEAEATAQISNQPIPEQRLVDQASEPAIPLVDSIDKRAEPVTNDKIISPASINSGVSGYTSEVKPHTKKPDESASIGMGVSQQKATGSLKAEFVQVYGSVRRTFNAIAIPVAALLRRIGSAVRNSLVRILPDEFFKGIPSSVMIFISIAIPVIIVVAASQVYFSLGKEAKNQALYAQAVRQAEEAEKQADLLAKKAGWENTLDTLEALDDNLEVNTLRARAINALDELQLVTRLDYQVALEKKLPAEISITQLAVSGGNLYLLDGNSGNVIRAYETTKGYVVDTTFQCGPTVQGLPVSGPLIDIAVWPVGFIPPAEVVAIDANWNVLLCSKNTEPDVYDLAKPTNAAIGNLTSFTLDMDDLYVLDPASNAVWIYWNNQMINSPEEEPYPFFKDEIPVLSDITDMLMSIDELHLLHSDGHLSVCVYSGIKEIPTRCSDPTFIDFRPGYENIPLVPLPRFSQMIYTPPPEPSLYFLDPDTTAIYKFSVRSLGFQRQYLPAQELAIKHVTAFGIDHIRRVIFLAAGNDVFTATMP